jgi:hypothetical protein
MLGVLLSAEEPQPCLADEPLGIYPPPPCPLSAMHAKEATPATITSPGAAPLHHEDGLLLDEPPLEDPEADASALLLPQMEEDSAVSLTWKKTGSLSCWDDTDSPVLRPVAAPAGEMMENMEGTTCPAYFFTVFLPVVAGTH